MEEDEDEDEVGLVVNGRFEGDKGSIGVRRSKMAGMTSSARMVVTMVLSMPAMLSVFWVGLRGE